ncbi:MAG: redoxin domain-containing protein [Planctomycetaceae bacterium]|nr:redoxin domain-containing protein [Planctomycetaceae bacterium]
MLKRLLDPCRLVSTLATLLRPLTVAALLVFIAGSVPAEETKGEEAKPEEAQADDTKAEDAEDPVAGHSYHGEVFNEGARQAAYLMGGTGNVHFEATCESDEVQKLIDQGIGQLHGFWYLESERSFRQAAAIDPDCAIAYWGMAMSNRSNEDRARGFIEEAVERKDKASARERRYIESLAEYFKKVEKKDKDYEKKRRQKLMDAYESLCFDYSEDLEAKAFLALSIYENKSKGIEISSYLAADALMNDILDENPLHPVHHFRIHLWDYKKPERALNSAAKCGEAAPAIAHMWHMPGHIYSRLKRYHDAVWQQEASARVDHAHMMRDRVLPDQIHNFAHNNEWLIRNLIHIGRAHDAVDLAKNMISLPRHPKYNTIEKRGSTNYGRMRLMDTLTTFEMWDDLLKLAETPSLEPTDKDDEQVKRLRAVGVAKFETGDVMGGCEVLTELKKRLTDIQAEQAEAKEKAIAKAKEEKKSEDDIKKAGEKAERDFNNRIRPLENAIREQEGLLHRAHGADADALAALSKVNDPLNPAWVPNLQHATGETDKALETLKKRVSANENETAPLARYIELLWKADKKEVAKTQFEALRKISSSVALDVPVFARLAPIAQELGYDSDWRIERSIPDDFGSRPELASLGPFRWAPSQAPGWSLKDHENKTISLSDYTGKPVLVIFYLGHGCLHCAEQLQAFAPKTEEFRKLGIELVAISTDNHEDLKISHDNYGDEGFPFPLVSNHDLDVFQAYRCFDDFEKLTLHGTFLIDAQGLVRWQDISYEPFQNVEFVLKESQRLLAQPVETDADRQVAETETAEE